MIKRFITGRKYQIVEDLQHLQESTSKNYKIYFKTCWWDPDDIIFRFTHNNKKVKLSIRVDGLLYDILKGKLHRGSNIKDDYFYTFDKEAVITFIQKYCGNKIKFDYQWNEIVLED